jgi:carnitine O-acetyltransferase
VDAQLRNGQAGIDGGRNRWLDKPTSIVVETNGRATLCGEHSPIDALIPSIVMDYITEVPVDKSAFTDKGRGDGWSRVDWIVDESLKREIVECEGRNKKLIEDSDASELWFGEYAVEWMKKNGERG